MYLTKYVHHLNPKFPEMALSSIDIPLVVQIYDQPRPQFKRCPFKFIEDDPNGAFSSMPYGVLHIHDVRA